MLQKYDIPIEFLDFAYIKTCEDVKMLEKIVKVLRSGEEGFYPDLTKCAEDRLKSLKPHSKAFRVEEPAVRLDHEKQLELEEEMKSWVQDMNEQDQIVKDIKTMYKPEAPIRQTKAVARPTATQPKADERIKSTDYTKWDKFDAEAAELKIDLDEERQREFVEVKNKRNVEKTQLIEEIQDEEVDCLSEFEKDRLSLQFKDKGNECYKAKEYDEAVKEYTQSLRIKKTVAAFNNRALVCKCSMAVVQALALINGRKKFIENYLKNFHCIADLKMKNYIKVISDTNDCLKMEPQNIKALLRKAQAFEAQQMYSEAFDTFEKVLDIDSSNQTALSEMETLRKKLPPRNAFRMTIEEVDDVAPPKLVPEKVTKPTEKLDLPEKSHVPKLVQNIVVEDASPFDKLLPKDKSKPPRETLVMPSDIPTKKKSALIQEINWEKRKNNHDVAI